MSDRRENAMKQMLLCSALWCLVGAGPVSATSIPTFDITFVQVTVDAIGVVGFSLLGPGTEISGEGRTICFPDCAFLPTELVDGFALGHIGGTGRDVPIRLLDATYSLGFLQAPVPQGEIVTSCGGFFGVGSGLDDRGNLFLLNGASVALCSSWTFFGSEMPGPTFLEAHGERGTRPAPTPEPATLVLLGSGLLAASVVGRKRLGGRKA